jgi:hypothetical protein
MPTPDAHEPEKPVDTSAGFETTDVNVNGIVVFLASLAVFVGVFFIFCFGLGKVINTVILKSDGPPNKWNEIAGRPAGKREDMTSNAVLEQQQLRQMVERFPTPRLQTDNGNQEVADMHAREDLLLDYYSWVDRGQRAAVHGNGAAAADAWRQAGRPGGPRRNPLERWYPTLRKKREGWGTRSSALGLGRW